MSELCVTSKIYGKFKFIVTHADGSKEESNEFDNLILNNAFSSTTVSDLNVCAVGSGTTEPSVTDTSLVSQVGPVSGTGTGAAVTTTWQGTLATVGRKNTYSFTAGSIVGNISEVAVYSDSVSTARIVVRTLVKDLSGNPTTITLTSGDQLSVEYTLFVKIETRPPAQTLNIKGVDYSVKVIVGFPEAYSTGLSLISPSRYPYLSAVSGGVSLSDTITIPNDGVPQKLNATAGNILVLNPTLTTDRAVAGQMTDTYSATIQTSSQLPNNASIKAAFFRTHSYDCNLAVVFDPPLPKNNTVGYTFKLACKIARA